MTDVSPEAGAPWIATQTRQLLRQQGHAWLLYGPSGLGQYRLALNMAESWLCEQATLDGACGECGSCHAIAVRTHADLCVLMPETTMLDLGWPLSEKAQSDIDDKKRKASKEIRVDAMRDAVEFSQRTSARGRGKVVLIFPAEQMNAIAANALLKTLEEPPGDVKFVLATESAHQLLPTIRSRCLGHSMQWPADADSLRWLARQEVAEAAAARLLLAAGGRPEDALTLMAQGRGPQAWADFPRAMVQGDSAYVKDWSAAQIIDGLHKLCHDLMAVNVGAKPRFFEARELSGMTPSLESLSAWSVQLSRCMRTMDHPFNPGLMLESLVMQAKSALNSKVTAYPT
jgi:DNA polymerase-3 subunit delta'